MKLTLLGTAAGDGYPAHWCECENCTYARTHGGRNLRGNTTALLNDDLLIDLSHHAPMTAAHLGIKLGRVKYMLVTHAHGDHLYPPHLNWRYGRDTIEEVDGHRRGGPRSSPMEPLAIYGPEPVYERISHLFEDELTPQRAMRFEAITPGTVLELDGYTVRAIQGNHVRPGYTLNYVIHQEDKTLLYAVDTGDYDEETLAEAAKDRYDLVVMECTAGLTPYGAGKGHSSLVQNRRMRQALLHRGCITPDTPFILTHMSPHWAPPYDLFVETAAQEGMTVGYDGMVLEC